jgi:transketolase N-terminal domain/subunit
MKNVLILNRIRRKILNLVYSSKAPHIGSSFSCVDIIFVLYKYNKIFNNNKVIF